MGTIRLCRKSAAKAIEWLDSVPPEGEFCDFMPPPDMPEGALRMIIAGFLIGLADPGDAAEMIRGEIDYRDGKGDG